MGSREGSAAHQQSPASPHSNAAPQRAQVICRGAMAVGGGMLGLGRAKRAAVTLQNRIGLIAMAMAIPAVIDLIGAGGAALTTLCWLPQAIKVIREKETRALSLPATAAFTVGVVLWLVYGMAIGDWPLIGANAVTLVLMAVILAMKLKHG